MKQFLLSMAALAAVSSPAAAEGWNVYSPTYEGQEVLGMVSGISRNGQFAAVQDDENNISYLWNLDNPENLININSIDDQGNPVKTLVYDVNDEGMAVGCVYIGNGQYRPAYYKDGAWTFLPSHESTLNTAFAARISNDGRFISGIQMVKDESIETGSGYRAARWTLNEDGEYTLESFNELPKEVAHHQGFYMQDMSEDGHIIAGYIMCGKTQCTIPAICKDGEYIYWNHIDAVEEPWYYKGQIMGYDTEYYIDGFHDVDGSNNFSGAFAFYDDEAGKIYGMRTRVFDLDDEGNGRLAKGACVYDVATDTFEDYEAYRLFNAAVGDKVFISGEGMLVGGERSTVSDYYGIRLNGTLTGINDVSAEGNVLGGMTQVVNPATGEYQYFPVFIVADGAGVGCIGGTDANVKVSVAEGCIIVDGTSEVAVYDIQGRQVGASERTAVASGLYIVKAGDKAVKVMVK